MPVQNVPMDFIAYNPDGTIALLAEAKARLGTSTTWAAKFRRNIVEHGSLPQAEYFLIVTPERIYGWKHAGLSIDEISPHFTIEARGALAPYFTKFHQDAESISPPAFQLLILAWLDDLTRSTDQGTQIDPSLVPLSESGLLSSLQGAHIEMNSTG